MTKHAIALTLMLALGLVIVYGLVTGIFAAAVAVVSHFIARHIGGISLDIS